MSPFDPSAEQGLIQTLLNARALVMRTLRGQVHGSVPGPRLGKLRFSRSSASCRLPDHPDRKPRLKNSLRDL
jgi:hypothetical protein